MLFKNKKLIEKIYNDKSFSILRVPVKQSEYLAFSYDDFKSVISLLKLEKIIICSIELYTNSYRITAPNFSYQGGDPDKCFELIDEFLNKLYEHNNMYYALEISSNDPKSSELKLSLDKIALSKIPLQR